MYLIDTGGWLAFFAGAPLSEQYKRYLQGPDTVLCPTIVLYEVTKKIELTNGRQAAAEAAAQLQKMTVVPLDEALATAAARSSIQYKLPMADAIIYTTALVYGATLVTSDAHYQALPSVIYLPHPGKN